MSGMAVAAGPIIGGWLLEHFWWGSVFFINVPIVIVVALVGVVALVPESRERRRAAARPGRRSCSRSRRSRHARVHDHRGARVGLGSAPTTVGGFAVGRGPARRVRRVGAARRAPHAPGARSSATSGSRPRASSITVAFFALFGFIFLITQYFQLVRGYSPARGRRPHAAGGGLDRRRPRCSSPRLVERVGTTTVGVGRPRRRWPSASSGSSTASASTPYLEIVGQMIFLGVGLGVTTAPATESIMGSLSADKAGVGSAVNDTTRELGGTLGVAVIGSVFSSVYIGALDGSSEQSAFANLPAGCAGADPRVGRRGPVRRERAGCECGGLSRRGQRCVPVRSQCRLPRRRRRGVQWSRVRRSIPPRPGLTSATNPIGRDRAATLRQRERGVIAASAGTTHRVSRSRPTTCVAMRSS